MLHLLLQLIELGLEKTLEPYPAVEPVSIGPLRHLGDATRAVGSLIAYSTRDLPRSPSRRRFNVLKEIPRNSEVLSKRLNR